MSVEQLLDQQRDESPILITEADALETLVTGDIHEQGLLPYSSNYSFLVTISSRRPIRESADETAIGIREKWVLPAVYKPRQGENPLWDFDWGTLCQRETAAYEVSRLLNWHLVPPTVLRDGPHGVGSVQLFIDNDEELHYFSVYADARHAPVFRRLALFDCIINNADRKSGHCLIDSENRLWAIDHGICFHTEYKLRTVIWEFSGLPIDGDLMADMTRLSAQLKEADSEARKTLGDLLSQAELYAMQGRIQYLLGTGVFPAPNPHRRNFPWPPI